MPGGNANNYVYTLDPINSSDYSGQCDVLQGGCGTVSIQTAGGGVQQADYPVQTPNYPVQTTANGSQLQGTYANIGGSHIAKVVAQAAAKPRDDSTRMPTASVSGIALSAASSGMMSGISLYEQATVQSFSLKTYVGKGLSGCATSLVGVGGTGLIKKGFSYIRLAASKGFVPAMIAGCAGGAIWDSTSYLLMGEEAPNTPPVDDVRSGFEIK